MVAEKGDGRLILGMGFKPYGLEPPVLNQPFDIAQQVATDTSALKIRIDPEIGNRLVEMLPRRPSGNRAAKLRHPDRQP